MVVLDHLASLFPLFKKNSCFYTASATFVILCVLYCKLFDRGEVITHGGFGLASDAEF